MGFRILQIKVGIPNIKGEDFDISEKKSSTYGDFIWNSSKQTSPWITKIETQPIKLFKYDGFGYGDPNTLLKIYVHSGDWKLHGSLRISLICRNG